MTTSRCTQCGLPFKSPRKRKYCDGCKEDLARERGRDFRADLKKEFLAAYGGRCQCPCGCAITEPAYLTLGHISGGGNRHREKVGGAGYYTYKDLRDRGWPKDEFRIECFNCNMSRNFLGKCPREMNCTDSAVPVPQPTPVDIVEAWAVAARGQHLKIRGELLSIEQCEIVEQVLRCILADLELLK
jgi:hypothetical protein